MNPIPLSFLPKPPWRPAWQGAPWPEGRRLLDVPPSAGSAWSIPWSDLMMTMFVFFAVLYAVHTSQPGTSNAPPMQATVQSTLPPALVLPGDIQAAADTLQVLREKPGVLAVDIIPHGVRLAMEPTAPPSILREIASTIATGHAQVQVVGHAPRSNGWGTPSQMAQDIAAILLHHGVAAERLWVTAQSTEDAGSSPWVDILIGQITTPPPPLRRPPHESGIATWFQGGTSWIAEP